MSSARQNATRNTNASLHPTEVGKQAEAASGTRSVASLGWVGGNRQALEAAQVEGGHDWLCETMVDAPDALTFEHNIGAGWRDHHGKRGGKEAFKATWSETKSGAPLLRITVNDFRRDPQSWSGHDTITRLWDAAKGVPSKPRTQAQERKARLEQGIREYNANRDAEERERQEGGEAQKHVQHIGAAIERWHTLPPTGSSPYITRKGLRQLVSVRVTSSYDGSASSLVFMNFSRYGERQLGPHAEAAGQVAAAKVRWRTASGTTEEVRDLGMGKEKSLGA